jgi:hypothetical protein
LNICGYCEKRCKMLAAWVIFLECMLKIFRLS